MRKTDVAMADEHSRLVRQPSMMMMMMMLWMMMMITDADGEIVPVDVDVVDNDDDCQKKVGITTRTVKSLTMMMRIDRRQHQRSRR
jgi:hypothetical protein